MFTKTDHLKKVVTICFVTPVNRSQLDYRKLTPDLPNLIDGKVDEKILKKYVIR